MARRLPALVLALAALAGCGGKKDDQHRATPPKRPPAPPVVVGTGAFVNVGGPSLFVRCVGSGAPTVVLEAGFNGSSDDWRDVQPQLGRATRTCAYDRAGLGSSVGRPGVHDAGIEVDDLHRLLDAARIPGPYVLVGHSYGGMLVRLFASRHRKQTAGVVLVDAVGRDATRRALALWPTSVEPELRDQLATRVQDGVDLAAGEALDRRVRTLGDTPLAVVTAGHHDDALARLRPALARAQDRLWSTMQDELASLSSDRVHVVALRSDHFVQRLDGQPGVVVRAVRAVVRAAREQDRLQPCPAIFSGPGVRCLS